MAVQRVWHRWACRVLALGLLSAAAGVQAAAIVKAPIGSAGRINYVDEGPKTSTLTPNRVGTSATVRLSMYRCMYQPRGYLATATGNEALSPEM